MRCFVALPLPDPLVLALEPLLEAVPVGEPVPAENLHLTLAWLDEQPRAVIEAVNEALVQLRVPAFDLQLQGLGTFGEKHPTAVWAGIADPAPVETLQRKVLGALHVAGLDLSRRRFRPHVTLAWLPPRLAPDEETRLARYLGKHQGFPSPIVSMRGIGLYQSIQTGGGRVYELMADYPLWLPEGA